MSYASDLTDKQWLIIEPLITYKGYCRPRKYKLRRIVDGIFYILRSGCQWRMLPRDFPPWKSVYDHYYRWRLNGTWDRVHDVLRDKVREKVGKSPVPTIAIIDSRSVKSAQKGGLEDMTEGKKVKGRKHHIGVDTLGLLLAVVVHGAHISDTRGIRLLLIRLYASFPLLKKIWVDGGYKQGCFDWAKAMFGYLLELVQRLGDGFTVLRKRWIVERTFGWFNNFRRMSKDYEHNPKTSEHIIYINMITIMLKRLAEP